MQPTLNCNHPLVSVIVCTTCQRDSLPATLNALALQRCSRAEFIIVISRAVGDFALQTPPELNVRVLREPLPGVSRARNLAVQNATGEVLLFLDDDVIPRPDWLHHLLSAFDSSQVAAATGRVQHEGAGYYPEYRYNTARATTDWELSKQQPRWFDRAMSSDAGFGCNMAFRREFLKQHPFPEDLGAGSAIGAADEHFMFLKTLTSGHALAHRASAIVLHRYTEGDEQRRLRVLHLIRSATAFRTKLLMEHGLRLQVIASTLRRTFALFIPKSSAQPKWNVPLSRGEVLKAMMAGPALYFRGRNQRSRVVAKSKNALVS